MKKSTERSFFVKYGGNGEVRGTSRLPERYDGEITEGGVWRRVDECVYMRAVHEISIIHEIPLGAWG